MSEYINRDDIKNIPLVYSANYTSEQVAAVRQTYDYIQKAISHLPAANVVEHNYGSWILKTFDDGYGEYQLYECDQCGSVTAQRKPWCFGCGADMRNSYENN